MTLCRRVLGRKRRLKLQRPQSSQPALRWTAKLYLGFTQIVSPIDGVAGIATGQVGDFVGPQSGALTAVK